MHTVTDEAKDRQVDAVTTERGTTALFGIGLYTAAEAAELTGIRASSIRR
jgi:hypothetical protein